MKLRIKSFETQETLNIYVSHPLCTLQRLRELVSQKFRSRPLSSTIYFYVNGKDITTNSFSEESIESTGITSGDLIYFTTNPNGFSADLNNPISENASESMEIDDNNKSVHTVVKSKSFPVPHFLRKVFTQEISNNGGPDHKLLAIAVHAVLLESGFVEFDPLSSTSKNNKNWFSTSFYYTLPEIVSTGNLETGIQIKYQNLGNYCKVYGSLVNGTHIHNVLIDEDKSVPFLKMVWANCDQIVETMDKRNTISRVLPKNEVFEFWKKVRDGLSLPLMIDLCEKCGLKLPACFMGLPNELKIKIFELLSGVDIAKVNCVCSELRFLGPNENLWREKFVDEFDGGERGWVRGGSFKERFGKCWEVRKRRYGTTRRTANLWVLSPAGPRWRNVVARMM